MSAAGSAGAWAARQMVIDAANEQLGIRNRAAFDAYATVHPVGHRRCTERCQEAHRVLVRACADAMAEYDATIWGGWR